MRRLFQIVLGVALLLLGGCRVSAPGRFERAVARNVKQRITVGGKREANPLAASEENIRQGQQRFSYYCVACHGLDGQNTGVPFAERMAPPVPSLAAPEVQGYSDGQIKWIIENGIFPSGMPASKGILSDEEMWSVVLYIRYLPTKGSLGDPPMYTGGQPQLPASHGNAPTGK